MPKLIQKLLGAIGCNEAGAVSLRRIFDNATQEEINECYTAQVLDDEIDSMNLVKETLRNAGVDFPPYIEIVTEHVQNVESVVAPTTTGNFISKLFG